MVQRTWIAFFGRGTCDTFLIFFFFFKSFIFILFICFLYFTILNQVTCFENHCLDQRLENTQLELP